MLRRRVPCVVCGTPSTAGQTCATCRTGRTHADAEYQANRANVISRIVYGVTRCDLCGDVLQRGDAIAVDHIVALANGGDHTLGNLRPTHGVCNKRRGDR